MPAAAPALIDHESPHDAARPHVRPVAAAEIRAGTGTTFRSDDVSGFGIAYSANVGESAIMTRRSPIIDVPNHRPALAAHEMIATNDRRRSVVATLDDLAASIDAHFRVR
jgi:hypothetical protein